MIKDEKFKSNSFYQQVFRKMLFEKLVDKDFSCKFQFVGNQQRKRNIPTPLKFIDVM